MTSGHLHKEYAAAILAGGSSSRFNGYPKPFAKLRGKTILDHQLQVLRPLFPEILLITHQPQIFSDYPQVSIHSDRCPNQGPLGGIHSALYFSGKSRILVVAGDMPFIDSSTMIRQIEISARHPYEAIIPRIEKHTEPLHAIYPKKYLKALEAFLKQHKNQAVKQFLNTIAVHYWDVSDPKPFININTPEELKSYENDSYNKD